MILRMLLKQAFKSFDNSGAPCRNKRFLASKGVFLTESERSGERLLKAARRVSGSDSIYRIAEWALWRVAGNE
jgi:hypothetical protein